jgi:hypothetical protein
MRRWAGPRALDWVLWGPDLTVGAADSPVYNHNPQSGPRTILLTTYIFSYLCRTIADFGEISNSNTNTVVDKQAGHTTLPTETTISIYPFLY